MYFSHLKLKNWRNFRKVEISNLSYRTFIVGPNASGKSNLIDVFRFLRDVAKSGGGLQEAAVTVRGGVSKIRCLAARSNPDIVIEVGLSDDDGNLKWVYELAFTQTGGGVRDLKAKIRYERVSDGNGNLIINRPTDIDKADERLLEYTWLEQPTSNTPFREVADFFEGIQYLHIVPQLLRDSKVFLPTQSQDDFFGRNLIEKISQTPKRTRESYLRKIEAALRLAVPQFKELSLVKDELGVPHLQAVYQHWRSHGAKQWEDQFSDGTLRLIGFLWALLEGKKPLLLEEPELSLHSGIVTHLAEIIARLQSHKLGKKQVILTTHSYDLLSNKGINPEETLILVPSNDGTSVRSAAEFKDIRALLENGTVTIADAVLPKTAPARINRLSLELN